MPEKIRYPIQNSFFAYLSDLINNRGNARGGEKVWHGTDFRNIPSIEDEGFKPSKQGWYGAGVYGSHDQWTAGEFGKTIPGELPPGFRYKTIRANTSFSDGNRINSTIETDDFLRMIGLEDLIDPKQSRHAYYDIKADLKHRFPGYDGLRIEGFNEPQILTFDDKVANATYPSAGGKKVGPRKSMLYPPKEKLTNRQKLTKGLVGLANAKGYGGMSQMFAAGETGNQLAELVTMLSEHWFGRLHPSKFDQKNKKIK
jgi:hypothetical protein